MVIIASDDPFHLGVLSSRVHIDWALAQRTRLGQGDDPVYIKSRCFSPFPFPEVDDDQRAKISSLAEEIDAHRKRVQLEHSYLTLTGIYNVLDKLRAGARSADLSLDDRGIYDDGLVLTLRHFHDQLDEAVLAGYGWPTTSQDSEIVAKLLALNKARAAEERLGTVRWLRPEYQIPRFGSEEDRAELELVGTAPGQEGAGVTAIKSLFPANEVGQTAAVLSVLADAKAPMDLVAIAGRFRQGNRNRTKVAAVLAALTRMGFVTAQDQGRSFLLRRAA